MINLSPEREAELLADYKARVKAKEEANAMLDKMRADQKEQDAVYWKRMNQPHIIKKTEVTQKCVKCNCTIPVGSQAVVKAKPHNVSTYGYTGQFLSEYICAVCSKLIPEKVQL
jgi:hypothetical protein